MRTGRTLRTFNNTKIKKNPVNAVWKERHMTNVSCLYAVILS